jgi:hypothetical protein
MLDASMSYLRQFAPDVLKAVRFAGGPGTGALLAAVSILTELYATGTRKAPAGAPVGFALRRLPRRVGRGGGRHRVPALLGACVLLALRDGLRSGDVSVPGSRRYADPASFLLTPEQWEPQRVEFCHLARGADGEVRLTDDGGLVIPPLTAEDIPAEADALRTELAGLLPRVPLASVLVELDARTGFTDQLIHAGGKVNRPPELRRNLLYVVIAEATNMGLGAMAESCGVPYDVLAWTAEWYFRPETLEARTPRSSTTITGSRSPRRSAPAPCRPRTGSGSR